MSLEGWKEYKLIELGELSRGKSKHRPRDAEFLYGGKYPFIQTGDIKKSNHKVYSYSQTYSEAGLAQSKLWPKDTIAITIAANIADTAILTFPSCFPDSVLGFIADRRKCDVDFIEYLLQHYKRQIQSHAVGSVQDNINLGTFENVTFNIPPLLIQRRIAAILSSLDDKIELNRQTNQTLEAIAQTLFKEWFVEFNFPGATGEMQESELGEIPKGWKVGKLREICELAYGKALKSENRISGEFDVVGSSGIVGSHNEYLVKAPGIVIGRKGTIGEVIWLHRNFFPIDTTFYIVDKLDLNALHYHYFLLKDQDFKKIASDSAVPGLNRDQALNNLIVIPDLKVIEQFNFMLKRMFETIANNIEQAQTLTQLRDTILPRLMNGEISITNHHKLTATVL